MLMKPTALTLAIEEANRLQSNRQWVEVDLTAHKETGIIWLSWGAIHSNGQWEIAIASRRYEQKMHAVEVGPVQAHV